MGYSGGSGEAINGVGNFLRVTCFLMEILCVINVGRYFCEQNGTVLLRTVFEIAEMEDITIVSFLSLMSELGLTKV